MPTIAVYVKAADARFIERTEEKPVDEWVRGLVQFAIEKKKGKKDA